MSSAICFNLDQSKNLSSGNELNLFADDFKVDKSEILSSTEGVPNFVFKK